MSKLFPASKNSSPPNAVRSFAADSDSNHVPSTTSKAKPNAITATALAQRDRADAIPQPVTDNLNLQDGYAYTPGCNGVLDDHEGSDPNTPRLPPTKFGNTDIENIPQDAAVSLDLPDQFCKSSISSHLECKKYRCPSSGAAASTFASSLSQPGTPPNQSIESGQEPPPCSYNQDRSHIKSWLEKSEQAYKLPLTSETTPIPYIPRTKSHGIASKAPNSGTRGQEWAHNSAGPGPERPTAMEAREEAVSEGKRNRSSSRSSQSRVEKRIEATMADAEPSTHARSRKSSHVLGLFKENKSSHDVKSSYERQRTTSDNSIDAFPSETTIRANETFRSGHGGRPVLSDTRDRDEDLRITEAPLSMRSEQEQMQSQSKKQSLLHHQLSQTSSAADPSASCLKKSRSEPDLTADDWRQSTVRRQEKADCAPERKIPPRLLEEIRDYHNLTTPFHDKFRSTQPKSTGISLLSKDKETANRHPEAPLPIKNGSNKADIPKLMGEPENEEEESEHISSALYYPHEAPSPDALEDISIDDARKRKDGQLETGPNLPDPALPITAEDEKAEDVDIALQVHNKNRYLHGDLQKARPSFAEPDADGYSETGCSSASDSEYESLDETKGSTLHEDSSPTDDAEATPRASPRTRQSYLLSRSQKAHRGPKAPLGAVELKPYNHQVGGHTTVFRFSKRAVCKQLTNRENEFYEVIERQHPDLLRFLPRYVLYPFMQCKIEGRENFGIRSLLRRKFGLMSFANWVDQVHRSP